MTQVIIGILIPFAGTALGAAMVYLMRDKINEKLQKALLGFAAGVMIAASIWSLLIPAIEESADLGDFAWFPAAIGFLAGMGFLLLLDIIIPHLHTNSDQPEGPKSKLKSTTMLVLAVTLHNIPEGMAAGVVLAGAYYGNELITISGAIALSIGIAIQNFPEGAIISLPLRAKGVSKSKSFFYGAISGVVEPIAAIITFLLTKYVILVLPYLLAFAAGAMIYVVADELLPESQAGKHSNIAIIGLALGFVLMMILDIALG